MNPCTSMIDRGSEAAAAEVLGLPELPEQRRRALLVARVEQARHLLRPRPARLLPGRARPRQEGRHPLRLRRCRYFVVGE
jgi:hypothetical protein